MRRASKIVVAICGILGGWVGYWIGQPTISVAYWSSQPTISVAYWSSQPTISTESPGFAWWSNNVHLPAGLQSRLDYLADEQLFPLWRFLLSIGMAVLFVCVAALVVTWLPTWRARRVLQNGTPVEATVVRVEKTGEERHVQGRAGVERQLACELEVCPEGGSPYRARTTQFFTGSAQLALQPGAGVVVRYDPAKPKRVAIVEPVAK